MEAIRQEFFRTLLRFPTVIEDAKFRSGEYNMSSISTVFHVESLIALLAQDYQGIQVDLSNLKPLCDSADTARRFYEFIVDAHSKFLFKVPLTSNVVQFFAWLRLYGEDQAITMVGDWIRDQNEYKYLQEALGVFGGWKNADYDRGVDRNNAYIRVRYYGPIGTSGYAKACRDLVRCMVSENDNIHIEFKPVSVQNMNPDDSNPDNALLSSLTLEDSDQLAVDIVFIHSVPDLWIPIVKREKNLFPGVRVVGITVWETDHVPVQWIPHLKWADRVTFPNTWNTSVFCLDIPGLDTQYLPHPVLLDGTETSDEAEPGSEFPDQETTLPSLDSLRSLREEIPDLYVFYTINEFSGRKGMDIMLEAFIRQFDETDDVVLFVKTHGHIREGVARELIATYQKKYKHRPRILMDYSRWEDRDISALHDMSHCYITLTRSEGHGLGACQAALKGKRVIITRYGGQIDYLVDVDWVESEIVPASYCSTFDIKHCDCMSLSVCKYFGFFVPQRHHWAEPSIAEASRLMENAYLGRLSGNASTVDYLKKNFGVEAIHKNILDYMRQTMSLYVSYTTPVTESPYPQDKDFFADQLSLLPERSRAQTENPIRTDRPRVTVVGCSGYGNFGDDLYAALHRHFLGKDFQLYICNTQSYYRSDGTLAHLSAFRDDEDVMDTDFVVIGGGGLINKSELRSSIARVYFPYCQKNQVPMAFVSVGFGYNPSNTVPSIPDSVRNTYSPIMNSATLITVRTLTDYNVVLSMIDPARTSRVHVASDLAYGTPFMMSSLPRPSGLPKHYVVFSPTNFLSCQYPDVVQLLQKKLWEYPGSKLVFLPLDGMSTKRDASGNLLPGPYPVPFIQEEMQRVRSFFPGAVLFRGRFLSGPFLSLVGDASPSDSMIQTLEMTASIFRHAKCIVTGRYHGLVMAKCFGVPYDMGTSSLRKQVDEDLSPLDTDSWVNHYKHLRREILATTIPSSEKKALLLDPMEWTEDTRNTVITDLVTQSTPPTWVCLPEYIQAYDNVQLWCRKTNLLNEKYAADMYEMQEKWTTTLLATTRGQNNTTIETKKCHHR